MLGYTVGHLLAKAAVEHGARLAVIDSERRVTFRELNERCNRLAHGLLGFGLAKGDHVGILARNRIEFLETRFALAKAGMVTVPLNGKQKGRELAATITDGDVKAVVVEACFAGVMEEMRAVASDIRWIIVGGARASGGDVPYEDVMNRGSAREPASGVGADDTDMLLYTSGTTGEPKGIVLSHLGNVTVSMNILLEVGEITPQDRILHIAPLTHGTGFFVVPWLVRGACNVLMDGLDVERVATLVAGERITTIKLVPTILLRVMAYLRERGGQGLPGVGTIIYGGSPIGREDLEEAIHMFGERVLIQLYAQSEAPITGTILRREDHVVPRDDIERRRLTSAGREWTNVVVGVRDEGGAEVSPDGVSVGEVVIGGPHVMKGYWKRPEVTAQTLRGGWVHTGDLARVDEDGYVYLVDRKREVVITGGLNVYPREVETVLSWFAPVRECAVIGVPSPVWGEEVKAVVTLKPGARATAEEVITYCKARMAGYKVPKSVEVRRELPLTVNGKVDRKRLREGYWAGIPRRIA